jgi:predicted esterase YcpF (UPF0227 family)
MTRYVYLHGFNSGFTPANPKVAALETIGEVIGVTYDTTAPLDLALKDILGQLPEDLDDVVIVGTSLGAFYAAEVSRTLGLPAVLINPCIDPYLSLRKYVGQVHTNYVTGETAHFGDNALSTYMRHTLLPCHRIKPLVFVDMGDQVIPAQTTINFFAKKGLTVTAFDGGSHQFDHMGDALPQIAQYASYTSFIP